MFGALSSLKDKASNYFRAKTSWRNIFENSELREHVLKFLDLEEICLSRLLCKRFNEAILQALEQNEKFCFVIEAAMEDENATKKGKTFKIPSKMFRLRNVSKIDGVEKWLARVDTSAVHDVELLDCPIGWTDVLNLLSHFENMDTLKIDARDDDFASVYPWDENEKDKKLKDEKRFKLLKEKEEAISQILPPQVLMQKMRKLKKFYHDSMFVHYSAILLKILPIKHENIEEFFLYIGSSDVAQDDKKSVPHLFASLSNCLAKNAVSLKKVVIDTYCDSSIGIDRNQRIFFNEFSKSLVPILKTPLTNLTDLSLNFANPNFDCDENRNKLRRFIKTLTALKNMQLGPIQMKKNFEKLILTVVPQDVSCFYKAIYMFQREPRYLVANNFSCSDVSFKLSRTDQETQEIISVQEYNFKNYLPENINFEKSMIYEVLPLLTTLHIDQNPQVVDENMRLFIQDREMQNIISRGLSIQSLSLRCNLKLLTDSGLTGLTQESCKNILEQFKISNDAGNQALNGRNFLETTKTELGVSVSNMLRLENLALFNAGELVTDATAFISIFGMPALKSILVTSPNLTEMGLQAIRNNFPESTLTIEWHS